MAPLFHATTKPLAERRVLPATGLDLLLVSEYKRKLEEFLELYHPQELQSRLLSWFAFDKECQAAIFLDAEPRLHPEQANATKLLYQVSMASPSRHPMVVAEGVAKLLCQGKVEHAIAAAKEYWRPTRDWEFWEYLSADLEVVSRRSWPERNGPPMCAAQITYEKDKERCATFLRELS